MRTVFVVNPAAGHGRGEDRWAQAQPRALAALPGSAVWKTERAGHGAELARRALADGFEAIVAVGGDGTIGEVVDGFLSAAASQRGKTALGVWPAGSGCDLARHLGITADGDSMLKLLSKPAVRRLDAGRLEFNGPEGRAVRRYFLNVVSLGIGGEVGRRIAGSGKPLGGTLSYLAISLACLARAKAYPMKLVIDGAAQPEAGYHLIAVANTSTTGGGMRIAPQADAQDGFLDFVSVGDLPRWRLFGRFPLIYSGSHLGTPGVSHRKIKRLEVRSSETVYLNIDGEALGTLPAVFEVVPAAVPFLCHEGS